MDLDTPVSLYRTFAQEKYSFLLESVEKGEKWGRYSFIGLYPSVIFSSTGKNVAIIEGRRKSCILSDDPLAELKKVLNRYRFVAPEGSDLPRFAGGAVGFVSYDMVRFFERLPNRTKDDRQVPDLCFVVPQILLVADSLEQTLTFIYDARIQNRSSVKKEYERGGRMIRSVSKALRHPLEEKRPVKARVSLKWKESLGREAYKKSVERTREYIMAGDITQTVLSNRFEVQGKADPFSIYRALRRLNPSPYLFHFKYDGGTLVGASPETMVRLEDGEMVLRPIAGTRPRGKADEEDKKLEKELLADPKERAEHVMLVDLGRNDLGRVAEKGTVSVDELMGIERYSHVMHIVSNVRAKLAPGRDAFDVLRATFPAGTLSGSPKVRAMEIIEELEPIRRGPYGGCVGYFSFSGNMDMAITIRSIFFQNGRMYIQSGAGIVVDSDPEKEYQEVCNKARATMEAIKLATDD